MKILLVDDHAIVRAGLTQILHSTNLNIDIVESSNATDAVKQFRQHHWDLVLLDIRLPERSGVELLQQFKHEKPKLPVLMMSSYPESQYAVRLIQTGAAGYLSKEADDEEIIDAIKTTTQGKKYLSPVVAELLANHLTKGDDESSRKHELLSNREFQVFLELAAGLGPNEIAQKLKVSAKTITTHRARILQKMQMANNAEMTLYANRAGLI